MTCTSVPVCRRGGVNRRCPSVTVLRYGCEERLKNVIEIRLGRAKLERRMDAASDFVWTYGFTKCASWSADECSSYAVMVGARSVFPPTFTASSNIRSFHTVLYALRKCRKKGRTEWGKNLSVENHMICVWRWRKQAYNDDCLEVFLFEVKQTKKATTTNRSSKIHAADNTFNNRD